MSKTQAPAPAVRDAYQEALAFHQATFGRMEWPEGATTVFSFEDKTPVKTVSAADGAAFAKMAEAHNGAHQVWATITPRRTGTVQDGGYKMGKTEDLEDPRIIFIDLDVAKPGYPATIAEALRVAETFALIPHAITCSGGGLQLIFLLDQGLVTTKDKLIIRNLESAFKDHLSTYGFKMDAGVTTNLTRPLRVPGSWNRKPFYIQQHGGPLQAYLVKAALDAPLYSVDDVVAACPEDRAFTERYSDTSMPGTQMAIGLPVGRILSEVHGWTLDGTRWCSNVAGSSTERSASQYHHEDAGVETVVIWSGTTAEEYGVQRGRPYSSFDWLTHILCGGNYGLATRLAARSVEAGSFDELLALFCGKDDGRPYTPSELADIARKASAAWPEGLKRQHASALAFRGVAADVAAARGYRSIDNLAGVPGIWADSLAAHSTEPVAVQGSGMEIGAHGASKALTETRTVRADRSAVFQVMGKKGAEEMDHPGRGMAPFLEASWDHGALDANPSVKDAVAEREVPLILVSVGIKYNLGQIHADGIISAARREGLEAAVVSSEFFTSTVVLAGTAENSTRQNRLGSAWAGIPLREREVYLAGRETWRRADGLITLGKALAAKGSIVKVLDFPVSEEKFAADPSVPSIADYLATGHSDGSLKDLIDGALTLDQAAAESVSYNPAVEYEVGKRIASELDRQDTYRFHTVRQMWMRNEGSHWVPDVAPVPAAFEILHRDGFPLPSGRIVTSLMKSFVAADAKLRCDPVGEERDPMEINVLNGVLNLESGKLRDRRHGEVHETVARAIFDPEAKAPRWQTFLDEIMPDRDTQAYLQEALGVAATGTASAEVIPMLVGSGANGKSILMRTIIDILGPFATSLSSSVIESGLKEYEWATLQSCRLVQIAELPQNLRANTGVLKSLAAPDPIQAAFKYGQPFTYIPFFSTFIMTNFLPTFKEMDDGTWRRLRVVRFNVTIPAERRDKTLLAKLAKERSGILNWVLEGAMRFMSNGRLTESAAVKADTAAYKLDLDIMGQFFAAGQVHLDTESRVGTKELHQAFQIWMAQEQTSEGSRGWNASTIARKLSEQYGIEKVKSSGDYYYKGLAFGPSVEQAAEELKAPDTVAELAPAPPTDVAADPAVVDLQRRRARAISDSARARVEATEKLAATGGW